MACSHEETGRHASTHTEDTTASRPDSITSKLYPIYVINGLQEPRTIEDMMQALGVPGVSIAFVDNGEVAWTRCYGYASLEDSTPVTPGTIFRGASLSKPLTAMAALHLAEQGQVQLDQDVNEMLQGWQLPENAFTQTEKVTLKRLIAHTAGILNDYHPEMSPDETLPANKDILSGRKLGKPAQVVRVPGERYKYSNTGYMLIAEVLSEATDRPFEELMDDLVLKPAGMSRSTFSQALPDAMRSSIATGYDDELQPLPYYQHPSYGAGAIWTTPTDLGKFLINLLDTYNDQGEGIISDTTAQWVFNKEWIKRGFNVFAGDDYFMFRNDGSIPGYTCFMMGSPDDNQALVVMQNGNSEEAYNLLNYIWRSVAMEYNWGLFEPEFYDKVPMSAQELAPLAGTYAAGTDTLHFTVREGMLHLTAADTEKAQALHGVGEGTFILTTPPTKYTFGPQADTLKVKDYRGDRQDEHIRVK